MILYKKRGELLRDINYVSRFDATLGSWEALYGLPEKIAFCTRCVISNQRPNSTVEFEHTSDSFKATIFLDNEGVCDACRIAEVKRTRIDWQQREQQLQALCDRHRKEGRGYDCLVPGSGGKDSFYCMVLSIQAKRQGSSWEAYFDNGREHSGIDAVDWAKKGQALGAGEILLTSVDREGTGKGLDLELIKAVTDRLDIPVIASGGIGGKEDLVAAIEIAGADAVAMAHVLHYGLCSLEELRQHCLAREIPVRHFQHSGSEHTA